MSPAPSLSVASRIASIESRIAGLRGITSSGSAVLGSDELFAKQLARQTNTSSAAAPAASSAVLATATLPTASTLPTTSVLPAMAGSTAQAGPSAVPATSLPYFGRQEGVVTGGPISRLDGTAEAALQPGADFGDAIVALAQRELGTPYVWGGESQAEGGFDCSGLVLHAYREAGIELPRVSRDQARVGEAVASLDHAIPGDLVAFGSPVDHIGIYAGDGMMVVAPRTGDVVKMQQITRTPTAIRRIVPEGTVVALPGAAATPAWTAPVTAPEEGSLIGVPFAAELNAAAQRHGVDPRLLAAVARAESGYDPNAQSPAGAQGLMQIMPATAAELGVDPFDPAQAADGAARYLAQQLSSFGSTELALAAYNAGPGNVRRYGGIPPFTETQTYVQRVIGFMGAT